MRANVSRRVALMEFNVFDCNDLQSAWTAGAFRNWACCCPDRGQPLPRAAACVSTGRFDGEWHKAIARGLGQLVCLGGLL